MINPQDEQWLKQALQECFEETTVTTKDVKKLEAFGMLIDRYVKIIEDSLLEIKMLYLLDPESQEVKDKLDTLKRNLSYLRRYCREKVK
ncbi:hypothetical protein ACFL1E_00325 [Candidatus Omnitrophota bacterium]